MKKVIFILIACLFAFTTCKKEQSTVTGQTGILDYAGKTYQTITINGKEWMAENLAYLPSVSSPSSFSATSPCYYVTGYTGTDVAEAKATDNYSTYGVLYNWPAALAACPPGWHLPSDAEWTALTTFLGGESVAGGKLKETGTTHWEAPSYSSNIGTTNSTGFAALPAGSLYNYGMFYGMFYAIGYFGFWWSSTESNALNAWYRYMMYDSSGVYRGSNLKECVFSVRCVRD